MCTPVCNALVYLTTQSHCITFDCMLIPRDELERTNKEAVVAYLSILSQQLSVVT
jgi:hypothetical protein